MVAQSCETIISVPPQWNGRTSPCTAVTADEPQPMDLVKRKRGTLDGHLDSYGYHDQNEFQLKTHQQNDFYQLKNQDEPRRNQDEAQEPHPELDVFQDSQQDDLQEQQQCLHTKLKLQESRQDKLQKDEFKPQHQQFGHDYPKQQQSKCQSQLPHRKRLQSNLQPQQHQQDKLQQQTQQDKLQQVQQDKLQQQTPQDKLQQVQQDKLHLHQQGKLQIQQFKQDTLQLQQCQQDKLQPNQFLQSKLLPKQLQHNKLQPKQLQKDEHCQSSQWKRNKLQQNEKKQDDTEQQQQSQKGVLTRHPQSQVEVSLQENDNEGATTLLLLADGSREFTDNNSETHLIAIKNQQNEPEINCNVSMSLSKEKDEVDQNFVDDENLIFVDNEQPLQPNDVNEQNFVDDENLIIVDNEQPLQPNHVNEENSITFNVSVDDTEIVNISQVSSVNDDPSLNERRKPSNNLHNGGSGSRIESQRKMEEGKNWLMMNLIIGGALAIIKLSDIENSYRTYCQENDKDQLSTPVLARLIHNLFPEAGKCRLGARGNQRINYRNLQFKSNEKTTRQPSDLDGNVPSKNQPDKVLHQPRKSEDKQQPKHDNKIVQSELQREESSDKQIILEEVKLAGEVFDESDNEEILSKSQNQNKNQAPLYSIDNENLNKSQNQNKNQKPPQDKQNQNIPIQDEEENCKTAAKKLSEVLKWITSQSEAHKKALLRDFAHSASCLKPTCVPVCMMFRRVRRHVVAAQHSCSVLRLYSTLLRHHVSSCTHPKCGLPACPALRATRPCPVKRPLEQQQQSAKRVAVAQIPGVLRPSSMVFAPRSPGGSLPGSPVNSPPLSPDVPPISSWGGHVQYVMVPVMMPVVENHSA